MNFWTKVRRSSYQGHPCRFEATNLNNTSMCEVEIALESYLADRATNDSLLKHWMITLGWPHTFFFRLLHRASFAQLHRLPRGNLRANRSLICRLEIQPRCFAGGVLHSCFCMKVPRFPRVSSWSVKGARRSAMSVRYSKRWVSASFIIISKHRVTNEQEKFQASAIWLARWCHWSGRDLISCIFGGQGSPNLVWLHSTQPWVVSDAVPVSRFFIIPRVILEKKTLGVTKNFREAWMCLCACVVLYM